MKPPVLYVALVLGVLAILVPQLALFDIRALPVQVQCRIIEYWVPGTVSSPAEQQYQHVLKRYWSAQQQGARPTCIVSPGSTTEVARTVRILGVLGRIAPWLRLTPVTFAIRSGGHTPQISNRHAPEPIHMDLSRLKSITFNADSSVADFGPGLKWAEVYAVLDQLGLAVPGGRVASVGVGGLVTGGGMSFFAPRNGFVCDNVVSFEIVIASGEILTASAEEHHDLWLALKGGSNNFGIVTRISLRTIPQGDFWGGISVNGIDTQPEQARAFEAINLASSVYDEHLAVIHTYSYNGREGYPMVTNALHYTKAEEHPAALRPLEGIQPQYYSSMRVSNMSDFAAELEQADDYGERQTFVTHTFCNDAQMLDKAFEVWNSTLQSVIHVPGIRWSMSLQAVPSSIRQHSVDLGGNSLGVPPSEGPLVLNLLSVRWKSPEDDIRIDTAARSWNEQIVNAAKEAGLHNIWIYLNYAAPWQEPIMSYGQANVERLRRVSHEYDPQGMFQTMVPGGFKLWD